MAALIAVGCLGADLHAGTVATVQSISCHNNKDNYGGNQTDLTNGSGMNDNPDTGGPMPADITAWTPSGSAMNHYKSEWQSGSLLADGIGDPNKKVGWVIFDLGSTVALDELHIWHIRENNGRWAKVFNVYVAATPAVAPPSSPTSGSSIDYDFSSGGWSAVSGAQGLAGSWKGFQIVSLTGYSGQYVAMEIIENNGDGSRAGFAEVGITANIAPPTPEVGAIGVEEIKLSVTGNVGDIQWQSAPGGGSFSDVSGETDVSIDVTTLYETTPAFKVEATSGTNAPAYSNTKQLTAGDGTITIR